MRVAEPITRINMPVAMGSSVPQWPIFFMFRQRRATATTSCEVMPGPLSTRRTPLINSFDFILEGFEKTGFGFGKRSAKAGACGHLVAATAKFGADLGDI